MSSDQTLMVPLVGAHFRPPAKQVLGVLPAGVELVLEREPDNPHDPKAIKVLVQLYHTLPPALMPRLVAALDGTGAQADELVEEGHELHLGYVADSDGKQLGARRLPGNREVGEMMSQGPVEAKLAFDADGRPMVEVWVREEELDEQDEWEGVPEDL